MSPSPHNLVALSFFMTSPQYFEESYHEWMTLWIMGTLCNENKTLMYEYVMFSCDISLTPEFFAALNFALSSLSLHAQHPQNPPSKEMYTIL